MYRRLVLLAAALVTFAPAAAAQDCGVFTDVSATSPFCINVTWMRNRSITLGCTATTYCPNDPVSRLQMAAFMNRMANALDPIVLRVEQSGGALDLSTPQVICQTPPQLIQTPRKFRVTGVFAARGAPDGDVQITPMFSVDASQFGNANASTWPMTVRSVVWHTIPLLSSPPSPGFDTALPGHTYAFGIFVARGNGTTNLNEYRCHYTVELRDRQE